MANMTTKLAEETRADRRTSTDVMVGYSNHMAELMQAGALASVDWQSWAPNVRNPEAIAPNGVAVTFQTSYTGIIYNTQRVRGDAIPRSMQDLLKPEYKGKIGLVNNADQAATDLYAWMTDTFGQDYWSGLAAQEPTFYDSAVPLQEALVAGEIAVAVWGANALVQPAMSEGAPVDFVLGDPGWSPQVVTYIPEWSAHPNAAQLLYDFLASDDGQAIVGNGNVSALPDVPGSLGDTSEVTIIDLDRVTDSDWVAEQQATWREAFGR
jgi:ABC-type Fe3+ transport system substrate-binding protein